MEIREATADDREWAAALLAASDPWVRLGATPRQCRETCTDPRYQAWIGLHEGERCGVALVQDGWLAGSPYLKSISVAEALRGRGLGSALLDFIEERARGSARWMFLCVSSFNPRARALYERRGYTAVGELPDLVVEGAAEILMRKRL